MTEPNKTINDVCNINLAAGATTAEGVAAAALAGDVYLNYEIPAGRKAAVSLIIEIVEEDV